MALRRIVEDYVMTAIGRAEFEQSGVAGSISGEIYADEGELEAALDRRDAEAHSPAS